MTAYISYTCEGPLFECPSIRNPRGLCGGSWGSLIPGWARNSSCVSLVWYPIVSGLRHRPGCSWNFATSTA